MTESRHLRRADRLRCYRQDNPLPPPAGDELIAEYAQYTAPSISRRTGVNENTVRSKIYRARTA